MASQNARILWRARGRLGLVGFGLATLAGVGLMSRAKTRLDAPKRQGKEETQQEIEIKALEKQHSLQVAKEFCTFADSSPSYDFSSSLSRYC